MDHSMSMHRHGLENMDLNQYQVIVLIKIV